MGDVVGSVGNVSIIVVDLADPWIDEIVHAAP